MRYECVAVSVNPTNEKDADLSNGDGGRKWPELGRNLLARIEKGDVAARWEVITVLRRHIRDEFKYRLACHQTYRLTRIEDAEGLLQDILIHLYKVLPKYDRNRASMKKYMGDRIKWKLSDLLKLRKPVRSLERRLTTHSIAQHSTNAYVESLRDPRCGQAAVEALYEAIDILPEERQRVIHASLTTDSKDGARQKLGISTYKFRKQYQQAVEQLKRILAA